MSALPDSTRDFLERSSGALSRSQSRLFGNFNLRMISESQYPDWTEEEALARRYEALHIASAAMSAAETGESDLAHAGYRRAAEIAEWLAPEGLDDESTLLSAAFYQLAELPAMARSIIGTRANDVYSAFLSGDFASFEELSENSVDLFGNSLGLDSGDGSEDSLIKRNLLASLNIVISDVRWGDQRIAKAHDVLARVEDYFRLSRSMTGWLFANAFRRIAFLYSRTSLRYVTSAIRDQLSAEGQRALERYVRGAYHGGRPIAWPTQRRGLERLVKPGNFALCTPTGSGKTTIAEIAILQSIFSRSAPFRGLGFGALALYIVPSRALASEVESRLSASFEDEAAFPIRVVSSYGGNDVSASEDWLSSQAATIIVCTQEKTDSLLRVAGPLFANRLALVIVDEAHSVAFRTGNAERSFRLETLIARLRLLRGNNIRLIALSAVIDERDESLGRWLDPDSPDSIRVAYQSTRRLFGRLTVTSGGGFSAQYALVNGTLIGTSVNDPGARPEVPRIVPVFTDLPEVTRRGRRWFGTDVRMRAAALWAAIHLSKEESATSGSVLITVGSKIEDYASAFVSHLNLWSNLPSFFVEPSDTDKRNLLDAARDACADYFGRHSNEFILLHMGIVVHHGKLPISLSRLFVRLIESGTIKICLATSTLSEGVNLPFETIIFPNLRGHAGSGRYSADEIRNVIGRAGRPGMAREGRALVLVGTGPAFRYGAKLYQELLSELSASTPYLEPQSALGYIMTLLSQAFRLLASSTMTFLDWLEQTASDSLYESGSEVFGDALEDLDSFITSGLVELHDISGFDSPMAELEEQMKKLWQRTYLHALDGDDNWFNAFVARSRRVAQEDSLEDLRQIYKTSMRPRSARILISMVPALRNVLRRAADYARWQPTERLDFILDIVSELDVVPQCRFKAQLGARDPDLRTLLSWWVQEYDRVLPPKRIGRWYSLASTLFSFRFNWSLSSALLLLLKSDPFDGDDLEGKLLSVGLPRVLQWFRDMMLVGTLDPVVAVLMRRGLTRTRSDAASKARNYYAASAQPVSDEAFSRVAIYRWISIEFPTEQPEASIETTVTPVSATAEIDAAVYRVRPQVVSGSIIWRETSGYPVAVSSFGEQSLSRWVDHSLDVAAGTISSAPYLEDLKQIDNMT